jgi:DNA topoisomerase-1
VPDEKKQVVAELKKATKEAEMIWLASDEDREGEAISWHLSQVLGLKKTNTKRIVFHEITKTAIEHAIENPRDINIDLVDAQQARRILDRLVGFELSPILWKKIKPQLSAGRVQSVAVRFLVEREREILDFAGQTYYKVLAEFETKEKKKFIAEHTEKFKSLPDAKTFLEKCIGATYTINDIQTRPTKRSPTPPFTTSTLQQEAGRKLGYSVSRTMVIAQKLYESGQITYMRTDSVNLSEAAIKAAESEITKKYGADHVQLRRYQTKTAGAQEAHEAIRPTHFDHHTITSGDSGEARLYELIWKRAIASQMADAQLEKTTVTVGISTVPDTLTATGEVVKFDGFLKVYFEGRDEEDEEDMGILPIMTVGEKVSLEYMQAMQKFQRPPSRFTEATLVKKLEEHGIGRPSTYAPTISTILKRGYVVKEDREGTSRDYEVLTLVKDKITEEKRTEMTGVERNKLFPTDIGMVVTDFLKKYFPNIMDYEFTATVEKEFDDIAEGTLEWEKMLAKFYGPFHKHVESTEEHAERASGERILGKDPKTGLELLVRVGRFGPLAQIGHNTETEKAKFAPLRTGQLLETITFEEALDLFKLPRVVGKFEDEEMQANIGRFGPYIKHMGKYYSIPKTDDPNTIHEDRAIEIIKAKREVDANKLIKTFEEDAEVQVLNGRYGPYIKFGKQNVKIPKETDPKSLTFAQCKELSDEDAKNPKPKRGRFVRKSK